MQQQRRSSPRPSGRAHPSSPQASNHRELLSGDGPSRSPLRAGAAGTAAVLAERLATNPRDSNKLKRVVQNFFTKAALTIISSRVNLPQCFNAETNQVLSNKWFHLVEDETEELFDDLTEWENIDIFRSRPNTMTIEVYLDATELSRNKTLVVIDDRDRRWDVCEALTPAASVASTPHQRQRRETEVVLERWTVTLDDILADAPLASRYDSPNVYKKAVVMFRSLYTYARLLPCWKFGQKLAREPTNLSSLRPLYRISGGLPPATSKDLLTPALYPTNSPVTETLNIAPTQSPAGTFRIHVAYRVNCRFAVEDAEALLSHRLLDANDNSYGDDVDGGQAYLARGKEVGSLPVERRGLRERTDAGQPYGSLSIVNNRLGVLGGSPVSALRAQRDPPVDLQEVQSTQQQFAATIRASQSPRSSLKSADAPASMPRRVSVSFQPFKAGSLSSSPLPGSSMQASPGNSLPGPSNIGSALAQARNRTSLSSLPQSALRGPSPQFSDAAVRSPPSNSPQAPATASRYSSSFSNRKSRLSSQGGSGKTDDDNYSSGRVSQASSSQQGSSVLPEAESTSPATVQTDDDNISDFLKLLDQKKDLGSFNRDDDASRDASTRRTTAALSRFRGMRDSNAALTDSMSASAILAPSSNSSSRLPSSVPPALVGNSISTSSSPGKPISPHTPHTPAIPSRLSANATVEEQEPHRSRGERQSPRGRRPSAERPPAPQPSVRTVSGAIDIPTSPQGYPRIRRSSSSVAHRNRSTPDPYDYERRSTSLPTEDDRPDLTINELLALREHGSDSLPPTQAARAAARAVGQRRSSSRGDPPALAGSYDDSQDGGERSSGTGGSATAPAPPRSRLHYGSARGSVSSFGSDRGGRFGFGPRAGAPPPGQAADDDEPLLFTMTVEDVRGGTGSAPDHRR